MSNIRRYLLAALFILPSAAHAKSFPFTVTRDGAGRISTIELSKQAIAQAEADDDQLLADLKESAQAYQQASAMGVTSDVDRLVPDTKENQDAFQNSRAFLRTQFNPDDLDNKKLNNQLNQAKADLKKARSYLLLAAPSNPQAFDKDEILQTIVEQVLNQGGQVLGVSPIYSVFEFLVNEYIESMNSRRVFYQNQLLSLLPESKLFTNKEKSAIRSSVYYSRISLIDIPQRQKAIKAWATFGNDKDSKLMQTCDGFVDQGDTSFGACFKLDDHTIVNGLVNAHHLSGDPALAYDYRQPKHVRTTRSLLILVKLGATLIPMPGFIRSAFDFWIDGYYVEQRKSEGYLYGNVEDAGNADLGQWIKNGSANPLL